MSASALFVTLGASTAGLLPGFVHFIQRPSVPRNLVAVDGVSSTSGPAPPAAEAAGGSAALGVGACAGLAVAAVAAAATQRRANTRAPAAAATSHQAGRKVRVARAVGCEDPSSWQPRLEGWSDREIVEARKQAEAMEGPEASYKGPRYTGKVDDAFLDSLIASQKEGILLPKRDAYLMVLDIIEVLGKEETLVDISIPDGKELTIVGDLHGQYWDFMNILTLMGKPSPERPTLFNGDFVDRGSWSIEVIMAVFALKLQHPGHVYLNRGNHEMLETNVLYGFCGECGAKYDMGLFDLFSEAFRRLPLAHLVEKKVLVLHGGLPGPDPRIWMPGQTHDPTDAIPMTPKTMPDLDDLRKVDRRIEITPDSYPNSLGPTTTDADLRDMRAVIDVLWSDPRGGDGYGPSYRKGKGVYMFGPNITKEYCEKNGLQCIIRSHEVKATGYRWDHKQLFSVFSAPNYLDTGNNQGAFARLSKPSGGGDIQIVPTCYEKVDHPDLPPMHWQEIIMTNYPHLTRKMKKKASASFDEFGDSDFEGLMNFDEWEPDEAEAFQDAFKLDEYGRELEPST